MIWNTPEVKQLNKERIRARIQAKDKCTKASISRETDLSVATCSTILNELLKEGEILAIDQEVANVGRPAAQYRYNPDYLHVLGMYVSSEDGRNTIGYAVADALGNRLRQEEREYDTITYERVEALVGEIIRDDPKICTLSFGIPGFSHHGVIELCDVETLVGIDMEGRLRDTFGISVEVRNDMDFIATGIYATVPNSGGTLAAMYCPNTTSGTFGCGFVVRGKVLRGFTKFSGEISYAAEGFGIPRERQIEILRGDDRAALRDLIGKLVLTILSVLDPEIIMLMGRELNEDDLAEIRSFCCGIVSERHLPRLLADNNVTENYIRGLIVVSIDRMLFPLSRSAQ